MKRPPPGELTSKAFWEGQDYWSFREQSSEGAQAPQGLTSSYRSYLLWDVYCKRHLPQSKELSVLEIGSAPGDMLLEFKKRFGYQPFGLEYTEAGAQVNRKVFQTAGVPEENVIHGDLFSEAVQTQYAETFDVVSSHGFIEHFKNVESVIDSHLNLLKPGGKLVITIPHLRGIYYLWPLLLERAIFETHNLELMKLATFKKLFERDDLEASYCGFYGTFCCGERYSAHRKGVMKLAFKALDGIQKACNALFRVCFADKGFESRLLSPNLLYIGTKR